MSKNKDISNVIGKPVKQRTLGFTFLKYGLIGFGTVVFLIITFAVWIYFSLFFGPGPMDLSDFHPFRSPKAKAQYFAFEEKMAKEWPVISEERIVKTSFGKTFMRISGPVDAPPLVLLPGGGSNSLIWRANIKAISEKYRTYALDNIYDFGRSVYTRKMENGKDCANWLNELFDTLHLGNDIRIMGYSYGGWVASQYAVNHPERLNHVVLIAPAFTVLTLPDEYLLLMLQTLLPIRYYKGKMMYWVWKDLALKGESGKKIIEDRIDYYEMALKCFKFKQPVNPTVLSDKELQILEMPVLYLAGENETAFNAKDAINRLNRINRKIQTELISGTGHDLLFTHTELVNRKILDFLGN